MYNRWRYLMIFLIFCLLVLNHCGVFDPDEENGKEQTAKFITTTFSVSGEIQTDDPWTTVSTALNEWAKPMYYVWFDMNGISEDGPYGNSVGSKQAYFRLDTGKLYFEWNGKHGNTTAGQDTCFWCSSMISASAHTENDISFQLLDDGKSFEVSIPLSKFGNPAALEIGFMCSPWTTSASDNIGSGNGNGEWFTITDATKIQTLSKDDGANDNGWPKLTPNRSSNFDMTQVKVVLEK